MKIIFSKNNYYFIWAECRDRTHTLNWNVPVLPSELIPQILSQNLELLTRKKITDKSPPVIGILVIILIPMDLRNILFCTRDETRTRTGMLPKGFSYHYSFHYQLTVRFALIKFRSFLTKIVRCLWSGLCLNRIESNC